MKKRLQLVLKLMRVKERLVPRRPAIIHRAFQHSKSIIDYPFEKEAYHSTRFGDGSYGVWYGSIELRTTVYETSYHMIKAELAVEGLDEVIVRERAAYKVCCKAILIDLSEKGNSFPKLVTDDYDFTQNIGQRLNKEGQPGLLAPSARCNGNNVVIFNPKVLSDPELHCYFTYFFDPGSLNVRVERTVGKTWLNVEGRKWYS